MAKDLALAFLFDLYGGLLSQRQQEIFDGYYNEDLSLSELADAYGISRQGVLQTIQQAERKLTEAEAKLGFASNMRRIYNLAQQIEALAESGAQQNDKTAAEICRLARQIQQE